MLHRRAVEVSSGTSARAAATAPAATGRKRGLHLTRRGRLVLLLLTLLILSVAFSLGRVTSNAATEQSTPSGSEVVVGPGDTLWSIASRLAPNADPRVVSERLRKANSLTTSSLEVGQHLRVP